MPTYKANMPKGNVAGQAAGLLGGALTRAPAVKAKQTNSQTLPNSGFPDRSVVDRINKKLMETGKAPRPKAGIGGATAKPAAKKGASLQAKNAGLSARDAKRAKQAKTRDQLRNKG